MPLNWIGGTLELTSKVRYGLTSRGIPLYRFIPYDRSLSPYAVGSSCRALFYNIHVIVEPSKTPSKSSLPLGNIVQQLGLPTLASETSILLSAYAYDNQKELRNPPEFVNETPDPIAPRRTLLEGGVTFHIDPIGCLDADDSFTIWEKPDGFYRIAINIADVASYVMEDSPIDTYAKAVATSFYTPDGAAIHPMLPKALSEDVASLIPNGSMKRTVSLIFDFHPEHGIQDFVWDTTYTNTQYSYTYEDADYLEKTTKHLQMLRRVALYLGASPVSNSHSWVERLMILYNEQAGILLSKHSIGVLRRHSPPSLKKLQAIMDLIGLPPFLAYNSAEYCLPTDENTMHHGLSIGTYAYASSPLRRYADLLNQRAIHSILQSTGSKKPVERLLLDDLNRRQKQAKAFQRDLFFVTRIYERKKDVYIEGIVLYTEYDTKKNIYKTKVWVPDWNRYITAKALEKYSEFVPGTRVSIQWFEDVECSNWKERIIFQLHCISSS